MTEESTPAEVAAIAECIRTAAPYDPCPPEGGKRDLAAAYATQDALAEYLVRGGIRQPLAGWKIAVNAPALMQRFGVSEPASGRVFSDQRHASPARLRASDFRSFAYEPEIAAVMRRTLRAAEAPFTPEQVKQAIARFVPALELIDLRDADMAAVHLPDIVAQNITNAGAVIGGPGVGAGELDLTSLRTEVTIDGAPELDVIAAAPQPPLDAVTWLANHLAARGLDLEEGHVVLCGTHAPIRPVAGPATVHVRMSGLGEVSLTLE